METAVHRWPQPKKRTFLKTIIRDDRKLFGDVLPIMDENV